MMSRRRFLHAAGTAASAAFTSRALRANASQPPRRYKLGLQLFTVRAPLARDVDDTLKRIAAMGYEEVETYGFDPQAIGYYGMPAKTFAQRLRDNNLTTSSGHYDLNRYASTPVDALKQYMEQCVEGAQVLGQRYITWPLVDQPLRTLDGFKTVAERLNIIGTQAKAAGLQVAYHNHDFEFVEHNGQMGYDIIIRETDPALVKLQIDLYWIARGSKLTANEWFTRAPGRFVMWHVKDIHPTSRDYTELGNGTIDFPSIWADASRAGLEHFFVEQGGNFARDPLTSVAQSAEYVKRVLLKTQ
jgi:sugar phosphate isomerase/epimerase